MDGNSLINRAHFAMSDLRNSKGLYTGGVHGLISMVLALKEQFEPSHFCVAFDMKGPTFRHISYEAYKGTRKGMPEELAMQMPVVKELLDVLKIPRVELQGYEADDLIGSIALMGVEDGFDVHVITGDKDALQLVAHGVKVHITKKGITQLKCYADSDVFEELGVHSNQVIDFKGLSGDASDNIPGIPGVGPKTAAKLLAEFETVENLIQNCGEISNKRQRELVETYAEQALLSKRLATICLNVPFDLTLSQLKLGTPNTSEIIERFGFYELKSLLMKLKNYESETPEKVVKTYVCKVEEADAIINAIEKSKGFVFKCLTDTAWHETHLKGFAFFNVEGSYYVLEDINTLKRFKDVFENEAIEKWGFDLKKEYLMLKHMGIEVNGATFDAMIAAYVLDPSQKSYSLMDLSLKYLDKNISAEEEIKGKGAKALNWDVVDKTQVIQYGCSLVETIDQLKNPLLKKLEEVASYNLFEKVEMPLIQVLADIEYRGFKVDLDELEALDAKITDQITEIESTIYRLAGKTFNINSPKQLGEVLFEDLGLTPLKKTKTGYSTGHDVLEKMMNDHAIIEEIIEYRTYTKLKSTYIDGLRTVLMPDTQRVHTSLNQTVAATGRLSSTEPNLQNIPIRLPYGRKIRKFFVADEGCTLLSADYSQIELRVLAHLSQDPTLVNAFKNNVDIHALTASEVFDVSVDEVTSSQRSHAKEVNFGIVYGMGDFGLSESLGITRKEAKRYIEEYFKTYPRVQDFMNEIIEKCKQDHYVETILGRKRFVPEIDHKNFMMRSAAERVARNTPIQGSAADIIKIAMIKVYEALKASPYDSKMILQVHDELILNVPISELEAVSTLLKECMESALDMLVPLKVDVNSGRSWYDVK